LKIQSTAQAVRDNTASLRVELEEAQRTLSLRKEYDDLAEKITSNRLLRPREEQNINLAKLNAEIAELERESAEYAHTWAERRSQFGRIIEEGMQLRRLIRDEKEEVERREGMEDDQEEGEGGEGGRSSPGTPRGYTPMPGVEKEGMLGIEKVEGGKSPLRESMGVDEEKEDEEMVEDGEVENEPEGVTAAPVEGLIADDEKEEGEQDESQEPSQEQTGEQMDIT